MIISYTLEVGATIIPVYTGYLCLCKLWVFDIHPETSEWSDMINEDKNLLWWMGVGSNNHSIEYGVCFEQRKCLRSEALCYELSEKIISYFQTFCWDRRESNLPSRGGSVG